MWIPYDIRASLKAETRGEPVQRAQADTQPREFLVGFYLRNPVTQAWELDLVADNNFPDIEAGPDLPGASLTIHSNENGKLGEVLYRLKATSAVEAVELAHGNLHRRLLRYMAEIGRGMAIAGWRVADISHDVRWRCTPFRPSAMVIDYNMLGPVPADLAPYVELFQRARNAPDAASRLLAGFAVLHAAAAHPAFAHSGASDLRVTQQMLLYAGALDHSARLLDLSLAQLLVAIRPDHDRLIGPDRVLTPVMDDLASQKQLAALANLTDLIAHRLILTEIRAREQNRPANGTDAPRQMAEGE